MANIYDTANQLERELRESAQFQDLRGSFDRLKAQSLSQKIQEDEIVSDLMQKEQAFSLVANDLNRIIMGPVRDLYEA